MYIMIYTLLIPYVSALCSRRPAAPSAGGHILRFYLRFDGRNKIRTVVASAEGYVTIYGLRPVTVDAVRGYNTLYFYVKYSRFVLNVFSRAE